MLDDPARVDAHVVGDHVAGQPDAARGRPVAQLGVGRLAAEVAGDPVVVERVGRGDRLTIAAHPLDPLGRPRSLPQADQPEAGDAPAGQRVELLVRDRVQGGDRPAVGSRQLVEPDVGALGHQDDARHPGRIGRERLGLVGRHRRTTAPRPAGPGRPDRRRSAGAARAPPRPGSRSSGPGGASGRRARARGSAPSARGCSAAAPASDVGATRAGVRISSMSEVPWSSPGGPSAKTASSPAMASA